MKFLHKNAKGEMIELPVRVTRAEDHQEVYAHGATGGPLANYHFRIDFYKDEFPPTEYTVVSNQIEGHSVTEIERKVLSSIYLPIPFLKELRNWLDKQIELIESQYGEIVLPKSDDSEELEKEPQTKKA